MGVNIWNTFLYSTALHCLNCVLLYCRARKTVYLFLLVGFISTFKRMGSKFADADERLQQQQNPPEEPRHKDVARLWYINLCIWNMYEISINFSYYSSEISADLPWKISNINSWNKIQVWNFLAQRLPLPWYWLYGLWGEMYFLMFEFSLSLLSNSSSWVASVTSVTSVTSSYSKQNSWRVMLDFISPSSTDHSIRCLSQ